MHEHAFSVFTKPYETCSYRYAECFSALDHDRRKSCYLSVKTLILNSLQVDINSFKSVQHFGNALWFTAASSVDDESFHDEAFPVRLLLLHLCIIPSAGTVS